MTRALLPPQTQRALEAMVQPLSQSDENALRKALIQELENVEGIGSSRARMLVNPAWESSWQGQWRTNLRRIVCEPQTLLDYRPAGYDVKKLMHDILGDQLPTVSRPAARNVFTSSSVRSLREWAFEWLNDDELTYLQSLPEVGAVRY